MNIFGIIYLITNKLTGKLYVGQTINFERRMSEHSKAKDNTYLHNSIGRYGWDNFKTEILKDNIPGNDLDLYEQYYIRELNTMIPNGYNLTSGGNGGIRLIEIYNQRDNIVKLYQEEELSASVIAQKYDCSGNVIIGIIRSEGIPIRDRRLPKPELWNKER